MAHSDPSAELPVAMRVLDATMHVRSVRGPGRSRRRAGWSHELTPEEATRLRFLLAKVGEANRDRFLRETKKAPGIRTSERR